jgi:hypothetical protein
LPLPQSIWMTTVKTWSLLRSWSIGFVCASRTQFLNQTLNLYQNIISLVHIFGVVCSFACQYQFQIKKSSMNNWMCIIVKSICEKMNRISIAIFMLLYSNCSLANIQTRAQFHHTHTHSQQCTTIYFISIRCAVFFSPFIFHNNQWLVIDWINYNIDLDLFV